jgi:hypothetical protein
LKEAWVIECSEMPDARYCHQEKQYDAVKEEQNLLGANPDAPVTADFVYVRQNSQ